MPAMVRGRRSAPGQPSLRGEGGRGAASSSRCIAGAIARFVGSGQIQNSGASGNISLVTDLTQQPTPTGVVAVMSGEIWSYQCWFRDAVGGKANSNFSDGYEITFQ